MDKSLKELKVKHSRQQKGFDAEVDFRTRCNEYGISCWSLEKNRNLREQVLRNPDGPCPDFLCTKKGKQIFVEVKTHTLLTNEARNNEITRVLQNKRAKGQSATTMFGPFDPLPELRGVFKGYLRSASNKFKNIKENDRSPRLLFINSHHATRFDVEAMFLGAYPSFYRNGEYAGMNKTEHGLFDSTGSNVSAIIHWNDDDERFEGVGNPKAQVSLSREDFEEFFVK